MRKFYTYMFTALLFTASSAAQAEEDEGFEQLDILNIEEMEKRIMDKHLEDMTKPVAARPIPKKVAKPVKPQPLIESEIPEYAPPTGTELPDLIARISYLEEQNRNLNGTVTRLEYEIEQLKTAPKQTAEPSEKSLERASQQYVTRPGDVNEQYVIKVEDAAGATEEVDSEERDFDAAVAEISAQNLPAAKDKFKSFITVNPDSERVDEAYFWLGEISMDEADYKSAALNYLKSYKADKNGKRAEEALLKSSTALGKLGKKEEACRNLTTLKAMETLQDLLREQANSEAIKLGCKN